MTVCNGDDRYMNVYNGCKYIKKICSRKECLSLLHIQIKYPKPKLMCKDIFHARKWNMYFSCE